MSTWEHLDSYLEGLVGRLGGRSYIFSDATKLKLSPPDDQDSHLMVRFERACDSVRETFGQECLPKATWKRFFNHQPDNWFVAEPVLSAYHLIIIFSSDFTSDEWISRVLDRARPALVRIVSGLPPLDGGRRAVNVADAS